MRDETYAPIDSNDPRQIAWEKYRHTEEFVNTEKWSNYVMLRGVPESNDTIITHPHARGSLWAAFLAGWEAALIREVKKGVKPGG